MCCARGLGGRRGARGVAQCGVVGAVCASVVVCTRLGKTLTHVTCDHNI